MIIKVNTVQGLKYHGEITNKTFTRRVRSNAIRQDDQSVPLNIECRSRLWALGVEVIRFEIEHKKDLKIYEIDFKKAISNPIHTNEYGDRDIRIPLYQLELKTTKSFNFHSNIQKEEYQISLL